MKLINSYEDYLNNINSNNLHKNKNNIITKFNEKINKLDYNDLKNILIYGPPGIGKYSQALNFIKKFCTSANELKYDHKIIVTLNKQNYIFKMSNIHFEIDMSLLGCNSKIIMSEFYQQLLDIVMLNKDKRYFLLIKYFQDINNELLDNFYSYIQNVNTINNLKFIIISEQISFIPNNILNCCQVISLQRPSKTSYEKISSTSYSINTINNIKLLHYEDYINDNIKKSNLTSNYKQNKNIRNYKNKEIINGRNKDINKDIINHHNKDINKETENDYILSISNLHNINNIIACQIYKQLINIDKLNFSHFREYLYIIFIYNYEINNIIWIIICKLIDDKLIDKTNLSKLLILTYNFLKYYNNNYRPIFHVENYFLKIIKLIKPIDKKNEIKIDNL